MINYTKREHARSLINKELNKPENLSYPQGGQDNLFVEYLKKKYDL